MQDEEKLNQVYNDVLSEPNELLGYIIPPIDAEENYAINTEGHVLWQNEELMEKPSDNTHSCWGFFPVVN